MSKIRLYRLSLLVILAIFVVYGQVGYSQVSVEELREEFRESYEWVKTAEKEKGDVRYLVDNLNQVLFWIDEGELILAENMLTQVKAEALLAERSGRDAYSTQLIYSGVILAGSVVLSWLIWRYLPGLVLRVWYNSRKDWIVS